jgi:hypothetical protein
MPEQPRPDANADEHAYTLTVEEAAERYEAAGHARTARAIQKYCARGDLDSQKEETPYGQRYKITPASVARHITQIIEVSQAHGREQPRPDAIVRSNPEQGELDQSHGSTIREQPRPDAPDFEGRYLEHLEKENDFLREQNTVLLERVKETNILTGRLQEMLTPLLGAPDRVVHEDVPQAGAAVHERPGK